MANCHNCERLVICPWANPEEIICSSFKAKPITNADRIRAMSDEDLADKFEEIQLKTIRSYGNDDLLLKGELKGYWLDWLKKEVSE